MSGTPIFEDFSLGPTPARSRGQDETLAEYETGYQAGWDDAVNAHKDAQSHLGSTLSQNLEQIEFTIAEAQSQLLSSIKPVMQEIAKTLFPGVSSEGLRALVVSEIDTLLKSNISKEISLVVSEADEPTIAAFLNSSKELADISLLAKETLSEGQAYISCAAIQRKIDVAQALSDIQDKIDAFLNQPELEQTLAR